MRSSAETISAVATPPGRGSVGILRVSGALARNIALSICGDLDEQRRFKLVDFKIGQPPDDRLVIDRGLVLFFEAPHSFTGEDVVEFQCHGGPVVLDMLNAEALRLGARPARAGEFSERAFLNGKMDLAQAEAIADLIDSASEQAARNAMRSLQGEFSRQIDHIVESVTHLRIYVEAAIDFPEEEVDFLSDIRIAEGAKEVIAQLESVLANAQQGVLVKEGMTLVLAGRPNAGKSSLMNQLAGQDTAIVTPVAGTTRDLLRESIHIDGLPIHIIDTAGLRTSHDEVEQEGIRRALKEIQTADRILLVIDSTTSDDPDLLIHQHFAELKPPLPPITVIFNKSDLSGEPTGIVELEDRTEIRLSAKNGEGLGLLRTHLKSSVGYQSAHENGFSARRRHIAALQTALAEVNSGLLQLQTGAAGELFAENLRIAQQSLAEITGRFSADDLLGRIFSSFCIGK